MVFRIDKFDNNDIFVFVQASKGKDLQMSAMSRIACYSSSDDSDVQILDQDQEQDHDQVQFLTLLCRQFDRKVITP